jgi:hypothetical protein
MAKVRTARDLPTHDFRGTNRFYLILGVVGALGVGVYLLWDFQEEPESRPYKARVPADPAIIVALPEARGLLVPEADLEAALSEVHQLRAENSHRQARHQLSRILQGRSDDFYLVVLDRLIRLQDGEQVELEREIFSEQAKGSLTSDWAILAVALLLDKGEPAEAVILAEKVKPLLPPELWEVLSRDSTLRGLTGTGQPAP